MSEQSDEQLVRAFQRGDEDAFACFVRRHSDRAWRLAVFWLRDAGHADDAVQEMLLRTYTGIGRFRFRAAPTTWMLRILRNVCHELNRSRSFVPLNDAILQSLEFDSDPVGVLSDRAGVARLRAAIATLPERQRQVVTLRVLEEMSIAETAKVMGCRQGTVKAHLNKATNNLKGILQS